MVSAPIMPKLASRYIHAVIICTQLLRIIALLRKNVSVMHLVLLSFGKNLDYHTQTAFCILSFLKSAQIKAVTIVTDFPKFYQFLESKVNVYTIDESHIKDWEGEHAFFWRVKMKAIQTAQQQQPEHHLLYVDSDTFLIGDLAEINTKLDLGHSFMHLEECQLKVSTSKTEKKMWQSLKNKTFEGIDITNSTSMWNAGVIAIPKNKAAKLTQHAIDVCDAMCATDCRRRLLEQFAFSITLAHHTELLPADDVILHYWGNKPEWNTHIQRFFSDSKLQNRDLNADIDAISDFNWQSLAISTKIPSIKRRLYRLVDDVIPNRKLFIHAQTTHTHSRTEHSSSRSRV